MEIMVRLEESCRNSDHESIRRELDAIESYELKKEAFQRIIDYYENEEGRFPVGYCMLFIKWLLKNGDIETAGDHIVRLHKLGAVRDRFTELICEYVVRPEEESYRERFDRNLEILKKNRVLISGQTFDFEEAIQNVTTIKNYQTGLSADMFKGKDIGLMAVDLIDFRLIKNILAKEYLIYLIYDDIKKFYYILLFEDLVAIDKYIERGKLLVFSGKEVENIKKFFDNPLIIKPVSTIDVSGRDFYEKFIEEVGESIKRRTSSYENELSAYYKDKDFNYYRELFDGDPSDIKIMLITSQHTELNKYITKNWYDAFQEMGYSVRLMIEKEPYEKMQPDHIVGQIYEFKPDMVFNINYPVSLFFNEDNICKNLLWIVRCRDTVGDELYQTKKGHENINMFALPMLFKWEEEFKKYGMNKNRILTTPEGININIFKKNAEINNMYSCDIVSVNNAAGSEAFRLDYYFKDIADEKFKNIILEMVEKVKEMVNAGNVIFTMPDYINIVDAFKEKLLDYGIQLQRDNERFTANLLEHIMDSLCRGRIMEWIIDSKITDNIKLWGKGWSNNEKFKKFHMGVAGHGDELSAIYRSSSISISDNPWTIHERNFEIFASGGFPLIRHVEVPVIERMNHITNHFRENEDVVLFYSKDDLLNKLQYYLDNPGERESIAENGRQVVINNISHTAIAQKSMNLIKDYFNN